VPTAPQVPIRIVLADDHAVVRRALRVLLDAERDLDVVAEAQDVRSAREHVRDRRPTVLLLDLHMPGERALDAIPAIRKEAPGTEIVVLTMLDEPAVVRRALDTGAAAYVLKEAAADELIAAVRCAAAGGRYVHGRALHALRPGRSRRALSPREADVLRLLALGHTNIEIAGELGLSTRTVETHRAHIQAKLELSGRAELVEYALTHGLVDRSRPGRFHRGRARSSAG
jgi:two-component system response regulator NreC